MKIQNALITALAFSFANSKIINTSYDEVSDISVINKIKSGKYIMENVKNNNFNYKIHCLEDYNDMCNILKNELAEALDALTSTFEFYQPVTFNAYVDDLSKYGLDIAVAVSLDIHFVPLKETNDPNAPIYLYPQALARQLNLNSNVNYKDTDFNIALNTFKAQPDYIKTNNNITYNQIILHEIIHGLGFLNASQLKRLPKADDVKLSGGSYKLVPEPMTEFGVKEIEKANSLDELKQLELNSQVKGFTPVTVYEKNIVDVVTKQYLFSNLTSLYKDLNCNGGKPFLVKELTDTKYTECYNKMNPEIKKLSSSVAMDYYIRENSIGILTKDGTVVPLQTFDDQYAEGSSVAHVQFPDHSSLALLARNSTSTSDMFNENNIEDYLDSEFLMYYAALNISKETYLKTVGKNNPHGVIGPGIVKVLTTLGYTEKGQQKDDKVYYVDNSIDYPEQTKFEYLFKVYELIMKSSGESNSSTSDAKSNINKTFNILTLIITFCLFNIIF
jgi:predicted SprT family Zn-dependent metalloprotease